MKAMAEVRVPIVERKGEVARISAVATQLDVIIVDIAVATAPELTVNVMVELASAEQLAEGLIAVGFRPTIHPIE